MKESLFIDELLTFLAESTSPWHAVQAASTRLEAAGFQYLNEQNDWQAQRGKFYTTRNDSSIIAWQNVKGDARDGIRIIGSHTDSPCLRVKPNPLTQKNGIWSVGVEPYGGVLQHTWFDRDLSLSGRIITKNQNQRLIDVRDPIAIIPSLAIHLHPKANSDNSVNAQLHLPPVLGSAAEKELSFNELLAQYIQLDDEIIDYELGFYDSQPAATIGIGKDIIAGARLDNLLSLYCSLSALIHADESQFSMIVSTDHEEVGSSSHCGAAGPFLVDTLTRLANGDRLLYQHIIRHSLLLSADNAHAVHPNYADKHEPNHMPQLNSGLVIKVNNNQRYATNAVTAALFKRLCAKLDIPVSSFVIRSDMGCGSTIGPITATLTGLNTLDVGIPQWAMHSIRESAGVLDCWRMRNAMLGFNQLDSLA